MFGHSQFHRRFRNPFARREVSTIYEVVYTTAAPTFTGEIGGYLTLGVPANKAQSTTSTTPAVSQKAATSAAAAVANASGSQAQTPASSTAKQTTLSTSTLPASIESPSTTLGSSLGILAATGSLLSPGTTTKEYTSHTVSGSVPTATADASTSSATMSTGAKAGLVIGILLLIGAILSLILFCFKKRRDAAKHERLEDEKHEFENIQRRMSTRTTATTATAPRLSLRPVTQFLPNLTMKRSSRGNALGIAAEGGQQWETDRPSTTQSSQANDPENPFGNHATQLQANPHENPFGNHAETIPPASPPSPTSPIDATNARGAEIVDDVSVMDAVPPGTAVTAVAAAAPGLKRGASKRENAPAPMDFTRAGPFMGPPSPAGTEFSMSSEAGNGQASQTGTGAAIAAAGGPAHSAVHRVQLDFNPSMEDELELRAGQLIRLLHEYDDGWVSEPPPHFPLSAPDTG
jgi:hypothetical protein